MTLKLGPTPDGAELSFVPAEPWQGGIRLRLNGEYTTWPAAPVIVFANGATWTATLVDLVTDTETIPECRAVWNKTGAESTAALGTKGGDLKIMVNGRSWWKGVGIPR